VGAPGGGGGGGHLEVVGNRPHPNKRQKPGGVGHLKKVENPPKGESL